MKVVINNCYGGFGLSKLAYIRYAELTMIKLYFFVYEFDSKGYREHSDDDPDYISFSTYTTPDITKLDNNEYYFEDPERDDPILVQVVEELGDKANGKNAKLKVVEIPDGTNYSIGEYDGIEHIAENHRTWR